MKEELVMVSKKVDLKSMAGSVAKLLLRIMFLLQTHEKFSLRRRVLLKQEIRKEDEDKGVLLLMQTRFVRHLNLLFELVNISCTMWLF